MGSQATSTAYTAFTGKTFGRAQRAQTKGEGNINFPLYLFPALKGLSLRPGRITIKRNPNPKIKI